MACLVTMYNNSDHSKGQYCPPISPRISFSNDFADSQQIIKQETRASPSSSADFEFNSVTSYSMMSADELFCKGKFVPFKENGNKMQRTTTIRDELLVDDDDYKNNGSISLKPPKGSSTRWKGLLGFKRSHIGSKKVDKTSFDGSLVLDHNSRHEEVHNSQEEGGSSHRDVEIGI
ncbi:uncharacterized protein LOC126656081 [Mercurialis annua]|uniref:uncharacterized protein LOC126656081 n=1 Tax=Mercurialis annua TaxID=3986 RepID=UPI00215FFDBB|nr:uncharacterized protein LOC126656081 [Mercurialis annua]